MSRAVGWRRRLARWIDPTVDPPVPAEPGAPETEPPDTTAADLWPAICEQFALRVLAAAYQMGAHLEAAEADEPDPDRLEKLYRIDHMNTRVRRQAENLQVLAGRRVDDAERQVTPLLDVIRAATSAIEHYPRVHIGRIADLAVVEYAADDVIRVLTELLDNATRFSPPSATVVVSAHLTEHGSVLVRVEDAGVGLPRGQLPGINAMLAGESAAPLSGDPAAHLGLVVVARLAVAHGLRIRLAGREPGGTTATVLLPEMLLCEIPGQSRGPGTPTVPLAQQLPAAVPARGGRPAPRAAGSIYRGSAAVPPTAHLMLVEPPPAEPPTVPRAGGRTPGGSGLPRRIRASLRGTSTGVGPTRGGPPGVPAGPGPVPAARAIRTPDRPAPDRTMWPDETADFAAGITDALRPTTGPTLTGPAGTDPPAADPPASDHPSADLRVTEPPAEGHP